ncbi:MAG: cobalt ECF transporter T component CbiQ [Tepidisphaerales bacterium]
MRRFLLDHYTGLDSPVHRLPAMARLVAAVALVIIVALLPVQHAWYLIWPAIVLAGVALLSRIPPRFLAWRLLLLEPFVLGVAVLAVFQPGGWRIMLVLAAKCTLCLLTMILLSCTTPFSEMLRVLRKLHVPSLMVTTLALMHRYLFVLGDEAHRMKRARMSRTFSRKPAKRWRTLATVISQLFIRASERAERVYAAMRARGWQ